MKEVCNVCVFCILINIKLIFKCFTNNNEYISNCLIIVLNEFKDELQNYFISYKQFSHDHSVSANIMYHFENYHFK